MSDKYAWPENEAWFNGYKARLVESFKRLSISRKDFAVKIQMPETFVDTLLDINNHAIPVPHLLKKILETLEISLEYLFLEEQLTYRKLHVTMINNVVYFNYFVVRFPEHRRAFGWIVK